MVPVVPSVPSVSGLRQRVSGLFKREPKVVVPRAILVVDNNAGNRQSLARLLESLGYEPLHATGLASAVQQLEEQDPDFVLLAFDLDDAQGLEALNRIRELDPNLPVVMLAANLWDSRVAEAMRQGAIAYLAQPFGANDLRELFGRR